MTEKQQNTKPRSSKFLRFLGYSIATTSLIAYSFYNHHSSPPQRQVTIPKNPYSDIEVVRPDSNKSHFIYTDEEFRNLSLARYQGAIKIPTEVYDFTSRPEEDLAGWEPFLELHSYFEKTFPLTHEHLKIEKINKLGLIITFEGTDSSLKPLIFTAHQDVVPVDSETLDRWNYEPYSAHFDGTYVWGRGSSDTKSLLVAILETFEELLKDGVKPKRTLILSAGYDEEAIGRYDGAKTLNKVLEDRYGSKGAYALIDEGGSVQKYDGAWIGAPAVAEKGYVDLYIELKVPGGHSSIPPDHTAIGIIGDLTTSLENDPYDSNISDNNPVLGFLRTIGETSNELDEETKQDYINAAYDPEARQRVISRLSTVKSFKYLFRTSQAIDVVQAGVKVNALPEVLTLGINHRIAHGVLAQDVINRVVSHVSKTASKHDLGVVLANDTTILEQTPQGFFNVSWVQPLDPSPISVTEGPVWDIFAGSIKHTFEDVVLKEKIHITPALVGGYTDASRYWPLTDHVYRFIGFAGTGEATNAHAINEHFGLDQHLQSIAFLYDYILNVDAHQ